MPESSWLNLLIQIPLVGAFIWYSLEMAKRIGESQQRFMEALDKRDEAYEKRNNAVIASMDKLNVTVCGEIGKVIDQQDEHDKFVRSNLAKRGATK